MNGDERGKFGMLPKKWRFLLDTQFDISEQCCNITKKKPFKDYAKKDWKSAIYWDNAR